MRTVRQIIGNFKANQELIGTFDENENPLLPKVSFFHEFGIQLKEGQIILINGKEIEMGKTEMLQYVDTAIDSVQLLEDNFLIIDCIFEYEEDYG